MNDALRRLLNLPPQASTCARGVDTLHYFVIGATMLGATLVFLVALYLLLRGRRRGPETTPRLQATLLGEVAIVGGVLGLFLVFWVVGAIEYDRMMTPPKDAMVVRVTAKQWMWKFQYPDGRGSMDLLVVPANRPVKLVMSSRDVIHSFYVPAFRIKHDVVPGRAYALWFEATAPGDYAIDCAEFCGVGHSRMLGTVRVMRDDDYARWLASVTPGPERDLVERGREVASRRGCFACHTIDGQPHVGPTWAGLYRSAVVLEDGRRAVADEAYLTRSIMDPEADIVAGYKPVMPTFRGVLDEPEVAALVEFMVSLKEVPAAQGVRLPYREPEP